MRVCTCVCACVCASLWPHISVRKEGTRMKNGNQLRFPIIHLQIIARAQAANMNAK